MRKPALAALVPFVFGILAAYLLDLSLTFIFALVVVSFLGCLWLLTLAGRCFTSPRAWVSQFPFWAMLLFVGAFRYELATSVIPSNHVSTLPVHGRKVTLKALVVAEPQPLRGGRMQAMVEAERLQFSGQQGDVRGRLLLIVRRPWVDFDFGDRITIQATLRKPSPARNPGGFDYKKYLLGRGTYGWMSVRPEAVSILEKAARPGLFARVILPIKRSMRGSIERNLSGAPASLLKALLLGERSGMPTDIVDAFAAAGVIHVLAISGLHVALMAAIIFFVFLLVGLPRKWAVVATIVTVALYAGITGLRPSVVRAAIMASVVLIGTVIERDTSPVNSLSLAALLILAVWPQSLFDVGFQLSFAAALSIVVLYRPLGRLFPAAWRRPHSWWDKCIFGALTVSVAAHLGTAPIIAHYFNRLPVISVIGNLLVVPAISLIVALGLLACVFGFWLSWIATAFNAVNWALLRLVLAVVGWLSSIPYASLAVSSPSIPFLLAYCALLYLGVKAFGSLRFRKLLAFVVLVLANLFVWKSLVLHGDAMEVAFLDVGQGDAIFVRFPNGRTMLIDGGDRTDTFDAGEQIIAPFLRHKGLRSLDIVLATHADRDHIGGLPAVVRQFDVAHFLGNGECANSQAYLELRQSLETRGVPVCTVSAGDTLLGLGNVRALVLHPGPRFVGALGRTPLGSNNASVVLKLSYGELDLLLTGDVENEAERSLVAWADVLGAEILKVPHHGSSTSSTRRFLDTVQPELAVTSVGQLNWLGHPSPDVLHRYAERAVPLLRTDQHGAVVLSASDSVINISSMLGPAFTHRTATLCTLHSP